MPPDTIKGPWESRSAVLEHTGRRSPPGLWLGARWQASVPHCPGHTQTRDSRTSQVRPRCAGQPWPEPHSPVVAVQTSPWLSRTPGGISGCTGGTRSRISFSTSSSSTHTSPSAASPALRTDTGHTLAGPGHTPPPSHRPFCQQAFSPDGSPRSFLSHVHPRSSSRLYSTLSDTQAWESRP